MKNGQSGSMWFLIGIVLALAVLLIYSLLSGGIVKKTLVTLGVINGDNDLRLKCNVIPGTGGDTDGDGIRDDIAACDKFKKTDS